MVGDGFRVEDRGGAERQQADHRPDLQPRGRSVGQTEDVVEEAVGLVPHLVVVVADPVHRVGDPHEVLEELERVLLVVRILVGQDERDLEHVLAVERHPGRPVGLLQRAAGRQRRAPIEDADVVEAEEAAGEDVAALRILAVHPPVEVEHQALERALQERDVLATEVALDLVEEERGPRVDRRIHVAEVPFVGRDLSVRVAVEAAQHQQELILGEIEVDERERERCGTPGPRRRTTGIPTCRASR